MAQPSWSFEGTGYAASWDPLTKGIRIVWQDLLEVLCCAPIATVSPSLASLPDPLESMPGHAAKTLRKWEKTGVLAGLDDVDDFRIADDGFVVGMGPDGESGHGMFWHVDCFEDRLVLKAGFRNPTGQDLRLWSLAPAAGAFQFLKGTSSDWRLFKMASNTTMPCGSVSLEASERDFAFRLLPEFLWPSPLRRMLCLPHERVHVRKGVFSSEWFTLLAHEGKGPSLLVGFLGTQRHFSSIRLDARKGCFQAVGHGEGCILNPGGVFSSHELVFIFGKDPFACLHAYIESFSAHHAPRLLPTSLWGTWYAGFYDRFRWKDILDNLDAATKTEERIEYFQVDDGYQRALGDWTDTKPNLPGGLQEFSRRASAGGMKPGIWLAPFAIEKDSTVFRNHEDWLVCKPSGRPTLAGVMPGRLGLRPYYGLDLTHPPVLEWLQRLFRQLVEWGFKLFKLDYLASGAVPGIRRNAGVTSAEAYHQGLVSIREAVDDLPLLGALAPQLCGVGMMDIQRVSTDSSFAGNHWAPRLQRILGDPVTPGVRNNLRNNLTRACFADRFWTNDCDAILFGGLSPVEQQTHIATNLLLGGIFQVGFDLRKHGYPWEEISKLTRFHRLARLVPDLFEREIPQEAFIVARDTRDGRGDVLFYLLLNLTRHPVQRTLRNPEDYLPMCNVEWRQAREFWHQRSLALAPGQPVFIPAHGSLLIELPVRA